MVDSAGFVVATGCLHGVGIAIGLVHRWASGRLALRAAGAIVALAGVFAHLVMSPADLALVVALTLLAGMRGARAGRTILAVLPVSWLAGGLAGLSGPAASNLEWTTGACFFFVGALVTADRNLSLGVVAALAAAVSALHGFRAGSALSTMLSGGLELLGGLVALLVVVTLVAGLVVSLRAYWARIAVRVLGSWIAATELLMLGWTLRNAR